MEREGGDGEAVERLARRAYADTDPPPGTLDAIEARVLGTMTRPRFEAPSLAVQWGLGVSVSAAVAGLALWLSQPEVTPTASLPSAPSPASPSPPPAPSPSAAPPASVRVWAQVEAGPLDPSQLEASAHGLRARLGRCLGDDVRVDVRVELDAEGWPTLVHAPRSAACFERVLGAHRFPIASGGPVAGPSPGPAPSLRLRVEASRGDR